MHEVANDGPSVALDTAPGLWDALSNWEAEHLGTRPQPRRFAQTKSWLIDERYAKQLWRYPLGLARPRIPGLFRTNVFGLIKSHLLDGARRPRLASAAQAIQRSEDGARLRLFYLAPIAPPITVKMIRKSTERERQAREEIALRRRLEDLRTITVPPIREVSEDGRHLYVAEAFVSGRRFSIRRDAGLLVDRILPELLATYGALGVDQEPLGRHLPAALPAVLRESLAGQPRGSVFLDRLERIIMADPTVPTSLCHGDLLPSNLAVSGGRVYVLDWGRAARKPISFDLLRLASKYPHHDLATAAVRGALDTAVKDQACSFEDQLTAYLGLRIAADPAAAARHLGYWARHGASP